MHSCLEGAEQVVWLPSADLQHPRVIKSLTKRWSVFTKVCLALPLLRPQVQPGPRPPCSTRTLAASAPQWKLEKEVCILTRGDAELVTEGVGLVHGSGKKWGFEPWQHRKVLHLPRARCTVLLWQTPKERWSPCCPDGLIFVPFHVCFAEITAVKIKQHIFTNPDSTALRRAAYLCPSECT